jgi:hypothetical protein
MRFFTDADQYQIVITCSCSYYDLFNIRREKRYVETGVVEYLRPTFKSLLLSFNQIVDRKVAAALQAKVEKAQTLGVDDQVKILIDLQNQIQEMGDRYKDIGDDVSTLLMDTQVRQMTEHNPQQAPQPLR